MSEKLKIATLASPIGKLQVACDGSAITELRLPNRVDQSQSLTPTSAVHPLLHEAIRQIDAYFTGELREFDLPLAARGTEHQERVWQELLRIPFGELISYGELARRIGRPTASRAVGAANGKNPIAIIIPCHRVIGANGSLTGYGGGIDVKRRLIDHEASLVANPTAAGEQLLLVCR